MDLLFPDEAEEALLAGEETKAAHALDQEAGPLEGALSVHNVTSEVTLRSGTKKPILKDVSALFKCRELSCIIGATGGGKTTLLDLLAGRGRTLTRGHVRLPGTQRCGYVVQEDRLLASCTVREALFFSAKLRLTGRGVDDACRQARVEQCLRDMQLVEVADSLVGSELRRGLSGGEKKRLSVGLELITRPSVLLCDEPTSGLDSATACQVMRMLRKLAKEGRCVVVTLHQPRFSIFDMLDRICVLWAGTAVFEGPTRRLLPFFESCGFSCQPFNNPADFVVDVLSGTVPEGEATGEQKSDEAEQLPKEGTEPLLPPLAAPQSGATGLRLREAYLASTDYADLSSELAEIQRAYSPLARSANFSPDNWPPQDEGWAARTGQSLGRTLSAVGTVCLRTFRNVFRTPTIFLSQLCVNAFLGLLLGAIYFDEPSDFLGLQNVAGVLFFLAINVVFLNLSAVTVFLTERAIFFNERANGYYSTTTFWLAKVLCDILPLRVVPVSLLGSVIYFMVGLRADVGPFLIFLLILAVTSVAGASVCLASGSWMSSYAAASLTPSLTFTFMLLFGGVFVQIDTLPAWLSWLQYVSIFKYAYEALLINEVKGRFYPCGQADPSTTGCPLSGDAFLRTQGFRSDRLPVDLAMLSAIALFFLLVSLWGLSRTRLT